MPSVISRSLGFGLLSLALLIGGCDRQSSQQAQPQPSSGTQKAGSSQQAGPAANGMIDRSHKGSEMPDLSFSDPAGGKLRLQTLKGKPLLLNLWATWCAPCVVETPALEKLAADQAGKIKVLTVSQDMQAPDKVAAFFKERGFKLLEPWLDPENDLSFHFNTGTLPTTVYYDAQGREVWRLVGDHDWASAETTSMLAEAPR